MQTCSQVNETDGFHCRRLNIQTGQWDAEWIDCSKPLPALPSPRFTFNRDALTLEIRAGRVAFDLDLASLTSRGEKMCFRTPEGKDFSLSRAWWDAHGLKLRDEVEAAAWEVFTGRRFHRSLLFGLPAEDFDVFDVLKDGATLDWELGAVQWPEQKRVLKCAVPIFEVEDDGEAPELISARYLCRGGSMLLTGPTGIGKSSLAMQLAIAWALGGECLGFEPTQPLATLFVQAENDAGDVREQRDGIVEGLELDEEAEAVVNQMVSVASVDDVSGRDFFARLTRLIRDWQPDVVVLDPLLAYVGGDLNRQEVAADFLRHRLNPILHRAGVAALLVHHTGKPPRDPRDQGGNPDYAGLGSSELPNWARAICSLTVEGDAFCLTLGKRGKRAGITDAFGSSRVWLRHAANRIFWEQCEASEVSSPKKPKTAENLLAMVPTSPALILKDTLIFEKAKAAGIGEKMAKTFLNQLLSEGKVFEHLEKRSRTNPLKRIGRHSPAPKTPEEEDENKPF